MSKKKWAHPLYKKLKQQHGELHWWPAESRFEIMVGAILTQNTAWTNVEKAIANLKSVGLLHAEDIVDTKHVSLAKYLKPSGYFNVKAKRLKNFCEWYVQNGSYLRLRYWSTEKLRKELLGVNGVGHETADDILLYAFNRKVFVIDAYTRRIFSRLDYIGGDELYDDLRLEFEKQLPKSTRLYAEYHALIVRHGNRVCKTRPRCNECGLIASCNFSA